MVPSVVPGSANPLNDASNNQLSPVHTYKNSNNDPFSSVGIALILGFTFMLVVDQCSRSKSRDVESSVSAYPPRRSFTATLGLVVHAAGTFNISEMKNNFIGDGFMF